MRASQSVLPFPAIPRPAVKVTLWEGARRPGEADLRAALVGEGYEAVKWHSEPHQRYLAHAHIYREVMWLVAGSMTIVLAEQRRLLELGPGDRIEVPAGTIHGAQAGPDGAIYLLATR